jgi:hypothetical protein
MIGRYLLLCAILVGALVTAVAHKESAPMAWPEHQGPRQLKFSHQFHLDDVGLACEDCHEAATSALAEDNLRSTHDNCMACHEDQLNEECGYCHTDPDNPGAVVPSPRHIIFSHEEHLQMEDAACETCHQGLDQAEGAGPENMPVMETCNTCHDASEATNACEACHVSFTNLIPSGHLVGNFAREHKRLSRIGALDVDCATCHDQNFCADCHAAGGLVQFGGQGRLTTDPSPRASPSDSPDQMMLTMAHDLNYRFTHGIDARNRTADCYNCHVVQEFCGECHMPGENMDAPSFRPVWHNGGGFVTQGRGSGGGRHAENARRDIESCVSCHDVQGMDPTCITCHFDPDGIRGTDPRTHPAGYMNGENGQWHTNAGATCYNCHTDFNARPDGVRGRNFCGYCHG